MILNSISRKKFFKIQHPKFFWKKKDWFTLIFCILFLVILPSLLVILELKMAHEIQDKYKQFTSLSPLETVLIDRFVVFIGTIIAVILITRSFTKPIHSLLKVIEKVAEEIFPHKLLLPLTMKLDFSQKNLTTWWED